MVIRATSTGADSAVGTVLVGVPGLEALAQSASDTLIGQNSAHPLNHFGVPAMNSRLNALADSFYATYTDTLYFNDMSLSYGGLFDADSNWAKPHAEHRLGRDADLRTNNYGGLTEPQRDFVRRVWERLGGSVRDETKNKDKTPNTKNPHYHLRYRGAP